MATKDASHSVRLMYYFENNHQTKKQSNSAVKSVIKYGNFQRIIKNIRKIERSGTKMPRKGANCLYVLYIRHYSMEILLIFRVNYHVITSVRIRN